MEQRIQELGRQVLAETGKIIIGKERQVKLTLVALLSQGHILLDDLPGAGKTTLVKTLSIVLGLESRRIQFVPDLLPADILGMNIFNQKTGEFQLMRGPIMTNLLLADEINRAIPRTQSALLEAMEEEQVTVDGETYPLPRPRWTASWSASPWATPARRRSSGCWIPWGTASPSPRCAPSPRGRSC